DSVPDPHESPSLLEPRLDEVGGRRIDRGRERSRGDDQQTSNSGGGIGQNGREFGRVHYDDRDRKVTTGHQETEVEGYAVPADNIRVGNSVMRVVKVVE